MTNRSPSEQPAEGILDAAVIGGGYAGLETTRHLVKGNLKTLLVESRDTMGGRTVRSRVSAEKTPMTELGAFFVYDSETAARLEAAGAEVLAVPDDAYFVARNGKIEPVGEDGGPIAFTFDEAELEACTENISIDEFLSRSAKFAALSPDDQKNVRAILEADLGAPLQDVGITSMLYDGQTVGEHEFFGICTKGGMSTLARSMADQLPEQNKVLGTEVTGIRKAADGHLQFDVFGPPYEKLGKGRDAGMQRRREQSVIETKNGVLAVPFTELPRLTYNDGTRDMPLISAMKPEVQQALNQIGTADITKVSVTLKKPVTEGKVAQISMVPPEEGPLRCSSAWVIPQPDYEGGREQTKQVIMLYLGGSQARDFVSFTKSNPDDVTRAVKDYLRSQLGIAPEDIADDVKVSPWIASNGGRTAYTYIKPGGPKDYNPRSAFKGSVLEDANLYLAGEAFDDAGATLTTGALHSGRTVSDAIKAGKEGDQFALQA
jgi:protoporphyrinogen oxidase